MVVAPGTCVERAGLTPPLPGSWATRRPKWRPSGLFLAPIEGGRPPGSKPGIENCPFRGPFDPLIESNEAFAAQNPRLTPRARGPTGQVNGHRAGPSRSATESGASGPDRRQRLLPRVGPAPGDRSPATVSPKPVCSRVVGVLGHVPSERGLTSCPRRPPRLRSGSSTKPPLATSRAMRRVALDRRPEVIAAHDEHELESSTPLGRRARGTSAQEARVLARAPSPENLEDACRRRRCRPGTRPLNR